MAVSVEIDRFRVESALLHWLLHLLDNELLKTRDVVVLEALLLLGLLFFHLNVTLVVCALADRCRVRELLRIVADISLLNELVAKHEVSVRRIDSDHS